MLPKPETFTRNHNNNDNNGNKNKNNNNNNNNSHGRDDPNIHQRGATLRSTEYSPTPWEECMLANACLDISHTQLSRPIT